LVIPELLEGIGVGQIGAHCFDVWDHTLHVTDACPSDNPVVRSAGLLHDIGKPASLCTDKHGLVAFHGHEHKSARMAERILRRLKFPNLHIEKTVHLIEVHMLHYESVFTDAAVRRLLRKVGTENFSDFLALKKADAYGKDAVMPGPEYDAELLHRVNVIRNEGHALSLKDLAVNGKDLMEAGIPAGQKLGQVLDLLLDAVTDDPGMNEKTVLLNLAQNIYKEKFFG
jgi:poly(A) polymerase/tRNA nucleotidyltransferase (CCA-adding enzyme)